MNYVTRKQASEILNVHFNTIYGLAKSGKIKSVIVGKQKRYDISEYIRDLKLGIKNINKKYICYCRVSSKKQINDLENQIKYMKEKYPKHEIISDIGSGLNYNRKGFLKILDYIINGKIEELVIAYRDRLVRFGFEMFEYLIKKYSNGEIKVLNKEKISDPMEEISKDILSIMNIYVAKINGLRKYRNKIKVLINNKKVKK